MTTAAAGFACLITPRQLGHNVKSVGCVKVALLLLLLLLSSAALTTLTSLLWPSVAVKTAFSVSNNRLLRANIGKMFGQDESETRNLP